MVTIRLAMRGAKKRPFYLVVASDSRKPRDSGYVERLGYFNPRAREHETGFALNRERYDYWLGQGARPSERVAALAKSDAARMKTDAQPQATETSKEPKEPEEPEAATAADPAAPVEPAEVADPAVSAEPAGPAEPSEAATVAAETSQTSLTPPSETPPSETPSDPAASASS